MAILGDEPPELQLDDIVYFLLCERLHFIIIELILHQLRQTGTYRTLSLQHLIYIGGIVFRMNNSTERLISLLRIVHPQDYFTRFPGPPILHNFEIVPEAAARGLPR